MLSKKTVESVCYFNAFTARINHICNLNNQFQTNRPHFGNLVKFCTEKKRTFSKT